MLVILIPILLILGSGRSTEQDQDQDQEPERHGHPAAPLDKPPAPWHGASMNPDLDRLRAIARSEPALPAFLDLIRRGRVRGHRTALRPLVARYGEDTGGDTRFTAVVTLCRLLESCGMGQLLDPTRVYRATFVWAVHPHILRDALASDAFVLQPQHYRGGPPPSADQPAPPRPGWVRHTFPLRPDAPLTLELPENLTPGEARRLGHFLLSVAIDG